MTTITIMEGWLWWKKRVVYGIPQERLKSHSDENLLSYAREYADLVERGLRTFPPPGRWFQGFMFEAEQLLEEVHRRGLKL